MNDSRTEDWVGSQMSDEEVNGSERGRAERREEPALSRTRFSHSFLDTPEVGKSSPSALAPGLHGRF